MTEGVETLGGQGLSAADEAELKALLLGAFNRVSPVALREFPDDLPVEQIGLDSLGLSQIVLELEEKLDVTLDDDVLAQLIQAETTGDLLAVLRGRHAS